MSTFCFDAQLKCGSFLLINTHDVGHQILFYFNRVIQCFRIIILSYQQNLHNQAMQHKLQYNGACKAISQHCYVGCWIGLFWMSWFSNTISGLGISSKYGICWLGSNSCWDLLLDMEMFSFSFNKLQLVLGLFRSTHLEIFGKFTKQSF